MRLEDCYLHTEPGNFIDWVCNGEISHVQHRRVMYSKSNWRPLGPSCQSRSKHLLTIATSSHSTSKLFCVTLLVVLPFQLFIDEHDPLSFTAVVDLNSMGRLALHPRNHDTERSRSMELSLNTRVDQMYSMKV